MKALRRVAYGLAERASTAKNTKVELGGGTPGRNWAHLSALRAILHSEREDSALLQPHFFRGRRQSASEIVFRGRSEGGGRAMEVKREGNALEKKAD